jgi:hypothetical protein
MLGALLVGSCSGAEPAARRPALPRLLAAAVQTREDEVAGRIEVAVTNRAREVVTVETLELRVPGLGGGGVRPKGEPLPAGERVNLPTPYGDVQCGADDTPQVHDPRVVLNVHTDSAPDSRRVVLRIADPEGLLVRIAAAECRTRRLAKEVSLAFGPSWRLTGSGADAVLHGTLEARLLTDQPRDITQLAGTVIYGLAPAPRTGPPPTPLAHLTARRRAASVPVVVTQARCDGHARGETKQPYAFLVWLGPPGSDGFAVSPPVSAADRAALQRVCPL